MTALAGYWSFGTSADAAAACERMLKAQAIYGPHGKAAWHGPGVALGRSLFRTLPEDAHDRGPVVGADGSVLVADVRIDNRAELAGELGLGGESAGLSDAGLLSHALIRWGEAAIDRLNGDFAFAWWTANRLLLARDYLGRRPLHYQQGNGFFALASMAKGLHALPDVPYAPDLEAAADFLALEPEQGGRSFFAGISRVPTGHCLSITRDGATLSRNWQPNIIPLRLSRAEDYVEAMRAELDRAVGARLRGAETNVAATLSAGLDSSAVCATAARLTPGQVFAFTSVPRDGYHHRPVRGTIPDEGPLAAATAALYPNIEHVRVEAGTYDPLEDIDRAFLVFERPVLNLVNTGWATAILQGAKARGCTVLLNGGFGNHSLSFAGTPALADWLGSGRLLRLAREAVALKRGGLRLGTIASQTLGPFLPFPLWKAIERLRGKGRDLTDFTMIRPERASRRRPDYRPSRDGLSTRMAQIGRVDHGNYMKGYLSGWGIDDRDPTADRRFVEFCLSVPAEQYLAGGMTRALARRALADRLPPQVTGEMRKGYQSADWHFGLEAGRAGIAAEIARFSHVPGAGDLLDLPRMAALIEKLPDRDWHKPEVFTPYRIALLRGVSAGHFLRKASGSNS